MSPSPGAEAVHVGQNIEALQQLLQVPDEALRGALDVSYNRLWDMKRRDWAQKKTIEQVAAALTQLSGTPVTPENVLTGHLGPESFARRAVEAFVQRAAELGGGLMASGATGGVSLPRLHLGEVRAGPAAAFQAGDADTVVRADPGDFVVTADGECMLPTIAHGDELVCMWSEAAGDGELAMVSYCDQNGDWQTGVKRVRRDGPRLYLQCDNRASDALGERHYPDIHPDELRIHAVVVGLWRPFRR